MSWLWGGGVASVPASGGDAETDAGSDSVAEVGVGAETC